ncbi:MAG: hypothetical protein ACK56I_05120, partial [bacterium]
MPAGDQSEWSGTERLGSPACPADQILRQGGFAGECWYPAEPEVRDPSVQPALAGSDKRGATLRSPGVR